MESDKLPTNYKLQKEIFPEITTGPSIILYWFFTFIMTLSFYLVPLLATEAQLYNNNTAPANIENGTFLVIGILFTIGALWFVRRMLRKGVMRLLGTSLFSTGRTLSDVRFLRKKKYIQRVNTFAI